MAKISGKKGKLEDTPFFFKCLFIYLAAWDHSCGMQELWLQHMGFCLWCVGLVAPWLMGP